MSLCHGCVILPMMQVIQMHRVSLNNLVKMRTWCLGFLALLLLHSLLEVANMRYLLH